MNPFSIFSSFLPFSRVKGANMGAVRLRGTRQLYGGSAVQGELIYFLHGARLILCGSVLGEKKKKDMYHEDGLI